MKKHLLILLLAAFLFVDAKANAGCAGPYMQTTNHGGYCLFLYPTEDTIYINYGDTVIFYLAMNGSYCPCFTSVDWYRNDTFLIPNMSYDCEVRKYKAIPLWSAVYSCKFLGSPYSSTFKMTVLVNSTGISPIVNSTGISPTSESDGISIFPNPSEGVFTLLLPTLGFPAKAKVYDMLGKKVADFEISSSHSEMNLTALPNGIYHLNISIGEAILNKKIIIRK